MKIDSGLPANHKDHLPLPECLGTRLRGGCGMTDIDALIAAADALADRAASVFDSEYHNTRHLEGALPYYEANRAAMTEYRAAREDVGKPTEAQL